MPHIDAPSTRVDLRMSLAWLISYRSDIYLLYRIKRRSSYVAHLKKHKLDPTSFDIDSMIVSSAVAGAPTLTTAARSKGKRRGTGKGKEKEKEKEIQIPKVPYVPPPAISRPVSPLDIGFNDPFLQTVLDMNDPAMCE